MKNDFEKFSSRNTAVVVIAPHRAEKVKVFWSDEDLPFIGVPDPDGRLGKLYGQEWNALKLGRMPALFIVDIGGNLALAHYGQNMSDIPAAEELLKILDKIPNQPAG
jgi:peroxiredoxin Q/BCP